MGGTVAPACVSTAFVCDRASPVARQARRAAMGNDEGVCDL